MFSLLFLIKDIRPARFFGVFAVGLFAAFIVLALPLLFTQLEISLVPRFITDILATGLVLIAVIFTIDGLILDSVARGRLAKKPMWYVANLNNQK